MLAHVIKPDILRITVKKTVVSSMIDQHARKPASKGNGINLSRVVN
jgi:hypothetical protein